MIESNRKIYKCGKCDFPLFEKVTYEITPEGGGRQIKEEYHHYSPYQGKKFKKVMTINMKGEGDFTINCPRCETEAAYKFIKLTEGSSAIDNIKIKKNIKPKKNIK
jgi:hypothetical protein